MTTSLRRCGSILAAAMVVGFAAGPLRAAGEKSARSSLNDGYSLFYHFCEQETQLSLLLWVKTTPPAIADYAKRISATAKDDLAIMKQFGVSDSGLHLDQASLPFFELSVRDSMDVDRKQQLIWDTKGPGFAQALCMTQCEATNYGLHVAKILAQTDTNPARAKAMRTILGKWTALHTESYTLSK